MQTNSYPDSPGHKEKGGTSEQAAVEIRDRAKVLSARIMLLFAAMGPEQGMTADEVSEALGVDKGSIRPRFTELKLVGRLYKTTATRVNRIGKNVRVWKLK